MSSRARLLQAVAARALSLAATSWLVGSLLGCSAGVNDAPVVKPPPVPQPPVSGHPVGLDHRLVLGYQGWFGCPGDFEGNQAWYHWFSGAPASQNLTVDLLPDTSGLAPEDLCDTGLPTPAGPTLKLYSSLNPRVVDAHFAQLAQVPGAALALQRFVSELKNPVLKRRRDQVLRNELAAAQARGLPVFLTYDLSGADPRTAVADVLADWQALDGSMHLTAHPAYLYDAGKPVLELWGFGFRDHPGTPAKVLGLLRQLKSGHTAPAATLIGGVPANWARSSGDAQTDPAWGEVYAAYDVLSPWTVGRYSTWVGAQEFIQATTLPDAQKAAGAGQRFLAVAFAGFSWHNLMATRGQHAYVDQIPRQCGAFLWSQLSQPQSGGFPSVYMAMADEFDEGTAMLPTVSSLDHVPVGAQALLLPEPACAESTDRYLQLLKTAGASFWSGSTLPPLP